MDPKSTPALALNWRGEVLALGDISLSGDNLDRPVAAALLTSIYGSEIARRAMGYIERAVVAKRDGSLVLSLIHLALAGLPKSIDLLAARERADAARRLIARGVAPQTIVAALEDISSVARQFDPNEPRTPKGNGRPSGRWSKEEGGGGGTPEATESRESSARNGTAPNEQHTAGVDRAIEIYRALGYEIYSDKATYVDIPGFATPRVYDFVVRDPTDSALVGVEVKTTFYDTIFLNRSQVDKDIALYQGATGAIRGTGSAVTKVAYEAFCRACSVIDIRYWYLAESLAEAGINVTRHPANDPTY